jgi:hypothetical protein
LVEKKVSFTDAKALCESDGMKLFYIDNDAQQLKVGNYIHDIRRPRFGQEAFWIDGTYTHERKTGCLTLAYITEGDFYYDRYEEPCSDRYFFFCEYQKTTRTTTTDVTDESSTTVTPVVVISD